MKNTSSSENALYVSDCFNGDTWLKDVKITWRDGSIISLESNIKPSLAAQQLSGILCAGFFDIQVNGGGGVLFNQAPNVASLKMISEAHLQYGTTAMLPTVITDELSVMQAAADAIAEFLPQSGHSIVGIHFEGPHLAKARRGIHPEAIIRPLSSAEIALFCRKDLGIVMVTVAPEIVSPEQISLLRAHGVIVCLGHSAATAEQVLKAIEAGARGFTHLFNAMSPLTSREPGMVGVALASDETYCGLILDHIHVHPLTAKLAAKCKGEDKLILVTDAMAHTGSALTTLPYHDTEIRRLGLKLSLPDGTLAGSALDMSTALKHYCDDLALSLRSGLKALSTNPARLCGVTHRLGCLQEGSLANMILLNEVYEIQSIWLQGIKINKRASL